MVVAIMIYSLYCPNCELFRYGSAELERGGELIEVESLGQGKESAYQIVREVCSAVGIPITEIEISQILGWSEDEPYTTFIPEVSKQGFRRKYVVRSVLREWVVEWSEKKTIDLPAFIIKSRIARDRYINVEITHTAPYVPLDWQAARQVLREIARAAIEERLRLMGVYSYDLQELILARLFPIDEVGKPDVIRWIRGFIALRGLRFRRRS